DDVDDHPLSTGRWIPHYAGGAAWPEARYWGGDGSDFKRKTSTNGEQQIYVTPPPTTTATPTSTPTAPLTSTHPPQPAPVMSPGSSSGRIALLLLISVLI